MLSGATAAESTEKEAIKQFKTAAKSRIGIFQATVDGARLTVLARIGTFDAAVATNGFAVLGVQPLVNDLAAFQAEVEEALCDFAIDISADGQSVLGTFTPSSVPPAFADFPGSLVDQVRGSIFKISAKAYRTVNKRLAKSSTAIGKGGVATFSAVLDQPLSCVFTFSNQRKLVYLEGIAIDLRVSAATTSPDATRLWAGGAMLLPGQTVNVEANPMSISPSDADNVQVITGAKGRFLARLGDSRQLARNNYMLIATFAGSTASSPFAIR